MELLGRTAKDMRHTLLEQAQLLDDIPSSTNTERRTHSDRTTKVADHPLRLGCLIDSGRYNDSYGTPIGGLAGHVGQGNMDGWDDVCGNALLRWGCLCDDV